MIAVDDFSTEHYLTFITKQGTIKKTAVSEYANIRKNGLRAINLAEDDDLINVMLTEDDDEIIIATNKALAIKFKASDARPLGRTAHGVRGIRLTAGDFVVGAVKVEEGKKLLCITENGYGKKTVFDDYNSQSRGGKGVYTYRITEKTGTLNSIKAVSDDDDLIVITSSGVLIRMHSDEINTLARQTQGVRVIRLDEGVNVVSVALTSRDDDEEEAEDAQAPDAE